MYMYVYLRAYVYMCLYMYTYTNIFLHVFCWVWDIHRCIFVLHHLDLGFLCHENLHTFYTHFVDGSAIAMHVMFHMDDVHCHVCMCILYAWHDAFVYTADSHVFRCSWDGRNKKKRRMGNSARATPIWSAACCTELRCVAVNSGVYMWAFACKSDFYLVYCVLQCVTVCCSVLHCGVL